MYEINIIFSFFSYLLGSIARRLAEECRSHVELAKLHTTAPYHFPNHYKDVSRDKFDDMLLAGEFLSYSEADGESYGLSKYIMPSTVQVADYLRTMSKCPILRHFLG